MGKKGKGNKLAKMSEEERARYLQLRADLEEEARRRKMQLISLYMKNKLKHEDAFCRLNMAKINHQWRSILRHLKCEELQQELTQLEQFSKEALERKDKTIHRLLLNLEIAEDMYATQYQSHHEIVDRLILTHQHRLAFLKEVYQRNKEELLSEYRNESQEFKNSSTKAREKLECVIYQLEEKSNEELKNRHEQHLKELDDIRSNMHLGVEQISRSGEAKLEQLWQQYQDVLSGYVKRTESFYAEYMDLKQNNDEESTVVRDNNYEIEKATKQLAHLKLIAADLSEKYEVKLTHMQQVKKELIERQTKLKTKVNKQTKDDEQKVRLMSVLSHKAVKHLLEIAKKGEILLQIGAACNKLVTEHEKYFPLGLPPIHAKQMFQRDEVDMSNLPEELSEIHTSLGEWQQMNNFWKRVNNAAIDVVGLKKEKKSLEEENAELKLKIQDSLVELNVNSGSNAHIDNYLKQRPHSMHIERVKRINLGTRPNSVIDKKSQSANEGRRRYSGQNTRPITSYVEANFTNAVRSCNLSKKKFNMSKIENVVFLN